MKKKQANDWFVQGVELAMDYFDGSLGEISQVDKDTYMASLPDLTTLNTAQALIQIPMPHKI